MAVYTTIDDPSAYFQAKNYSGNGSTSNNADPRGNHSNNNNVINKEPLDIEDFREIPTQEVSKIFEPQPVVNDEDNRLNYLTGEYLNTNLTPDQKEQYQDYRENVEQAINPMAKPSNIAIGIGLNQLIPGAGYLFGHYKQSTAMGYGMTNPLNGLTDKFGNAKDWVADKFGGLLDGSTGNFNTSTVGQGDNDRTTMNTLAPLAPYAVSETTPDVSQANKWYNSIGENTESTFNFAQAYADAKTKVTNNLRSHGPLAQLAVSDSPYYDWLKVNKMDKGIL